MDICLLTHRADESSGFGIDKCGYEIYTRLKNKHNVELVEGANTKMPPFLSDISYIPAKAILNKSKIVHALTPRQSLILPHIEKSLVTYHDFIAFGENHAESERSFFSKRYYEFLWRVGTKSKHIITNSKQTKNELIDFFDLDREKISVVNLGVDEKFQPLEKKNKKRKTIGYLSSMVKRKRVDKAIEFFKRFQDKYKTKAKLEIHGNINIKHLQCFNPFELVKKYKVKNVEIKGFVPENEIVETYNSFDLFLYPSDYEGFGLPVIEALSCGVPTIVRENAKITPEVKSLCIVANEGNIEKSMFKALNNKSYRKKIIKKGLKKVKRFNWENTAKELEEVYSNL